MFKIILLAIGLFIISLIVGTLIKIFTTAIKLPNGHFDDDDCGEINDAR